MTPNDLLRRFDELPTATYPPAGQPVTINGDGWAGQPVVKLVDLLRVVGDLVRALEQERPR